MAELTDGKTFRLRYVGVRFNGARLPVDVLLDLPAFRDLLVAFAKDEWLDENSGRKRVPKGFDKSISFDLVAIDDGSAVPNLNWNRETAQSYLPGFIDKLEDIVDASYRDVISLVDGAGHEQFPKSLSSEHIRALNRLGSGLRDNEKIEFLDSKSADGSVVYLDNFRRKALITRVRETYQARFEGIGTLQGTFIEHDRPWGRISVNTEEHGDLDIVLEADRIREEFDGNLMSSVQLDLQIEMDNNDKLRSIVEVFDVGLVDPSAGDVARCRARLAELGRLEHGWHDGAGEKITPTALENASRLLAERPAFSKDYHIYPVENGGILFEFEAGQWDISVEMLPAGGVELYGVEINGSAVLSIESFDEMTYEFFEVFDVAVEE